MKYKGVIWTNHILDRMKQRDLSYDDVYWVFRNPDKSNYAKTKGAWKFSRQHRDYILTIVATKNEKGEWVLMSCWWKDLDKKRAEEYEKKKVESWLKKFWRIVWGK